MSNPPCFLPSLSSFYFLFMGKNVEQEPEVNLGRNIITVKRGVKTNNSDNTSEYKPLANMPADNSCLNIYSHFCVIFSSPGVQAACS